MTRKIDKIVVHCAATPPDMDVGVKEIRSWHLKRGFNDIGYHFVIRRNGDIEIGRSIETPGAHVEGHNRFSIGICMVGGCKRIGKQLATENNFTPEQFATLKELITKLRAKYSTALVCGHRDLNPGKDCPSFSVKDKLAEWNMTGVWKK